MLNIEVIFKFSIKNYIEKLYLRSFLIIHQVKLIVFIGRNYIHSKGIKAYELYEIINGILAVEKIH